MTRSCGSAPVIVAFAGNGCNAVDCDGFDLNGKAVIGHAFNGASLDDEALDDASLDDEALDDEAFDDDALDDDAFTPGVAVATPAFSACQLSKPCSLATTSCASLSLKLDARISASDIFRNLGNCPRICAATG
ncbi:MAG: hypothetical protein WBV46_16275 [Terriglobales bacterium]